MEAPLSDLPQEIIEEILQKLPAKAVVRFKSVCKSWLRFIHMMHRRGPKLCDTRPSDLGCVQSLVNYSRNASLQLWPVMIVDEDIDFLPRELKSVFRCGFSLHGPQSGVYLLFDVQGNAALWNHATGDYKIISKKRQEYRSHLFVVFGFSSEEVIGDDGVVTADFLVLKFRYKMRTYEERVPKLYRSSTGTSKVVTTLPDEFRCDWISNPSVYVTGVLYWLAQREGLWFLVSFDTRSERFGEVDLPDNLPEGRALLSRYASKGDKYLMFTVSTEEKMDVWAMKETSVGRHWVREVTIENREIRSTGRKAMSDLKEDIWFDMLEYEESFLPLNSKTRMMERRLLKGML